ncbi:hypothetical protein [Herbiconiux sp. YIM B11900]|uniref:hypothetical protein n=1 Tax=Herbiconiux sp. YIM B11900 TaxID=3404131 RepID=UPI003F8578E9
MNEEDGFFGEADRSRVRAFELPVYFSRSVAVELHGLSTQSHNGQMDVVEVAYITVPRTAPLVEQPSVWTWRNLSLKVSESLRIHASTHLVNHRPEFRAGAWIPEVAEMDTLAEAIDASPRATAHIDVEGETLDGWRTTIGGWDFTAIELEDVHVTIAGRRGFAEAGLIPRLVPSAS